MDFDVIVMIKDKSNAPIVNVALPAHDFEHSVSILGAFAHLLAGTVNGNQPALFAIHSDGSNVLPSVHAEGS